MSDEEYQHWQQKKKARALQKERGIKYTEALRIVKALEDETKKEKN